jgi:hypothetical protein
MTPFAMNSETLFVPHDSPLSQVDLLAVEKIPSWHQRPDEQSHVEPLAINALAVPSNGSRQCYLPLQWLSLKTREEAELNLRVCARTSDFEKCPLLIAFSDSLIIISVLCRPILGLVR